MNEPDKIGKAFEVHDKYGSHMECLSCGSDMEFEKCDTCEGEGWEEVYEDDPKFLHNKNAKECGSCHGKLGEYWCPNAECKTSVAVTFVPNPNKKAQLV